MTLVGQKRQLRGGVGQARSSRGAWQLTPALQVQLSMLNYGCCPVKPVKSPMMITHRMVLGTILWGRIKKNIRLCSCRRM